MLTVQLNVSFDFTVIYVSGFKVPRYAKFTVPTFSSVKMCL